jgi:hypothetical protein
MTEADWLAFLQCKPISRKLRVRFKPGDRKWRLFACACCRRIWHLLADPRSRKAVEVAERDADGMASHQEVANAFQDALEASNEDRAFEVTGLASPEWAASETLGNANGVVGPQVLNAADNAATARANVANMERPDQELWEKTYLAEQGEQAHLLQDIFGKPSRRVTIPRALLAWNDDTIRKLAQAIYDERAFDRLPILADALEESGCQDPDILGHCRSGGEHVRGCWVIDLLLGKS